MNEEMLDLVNDRDEVIGRLSRDEIYKQKLHNYRVVNGLIANQEGKLWIPRRTAQKKLYPNALDYSAAGHVESGESYDESFYREVKEELNVDLNKVDWQVLGKLTPFDGASCFQTLYEIKLEEAPSYNSEEFLEARWFFPQELIDLLEAGEPAKSDLLITIKRFYSGTL